MGETVKGGKNQSVCVRTVKVVMPTCVFVERKVRRGPSRCCFVCNSAILARVGVIGHHSDNRCPRGALRAQTNSVVDRVKGRSVIINVNHIYLHIGYRAQSTLAGKQRETLLHFHMH